MVFAANSLQIFYSILLHLRKSCSKCGKEYDKIFILEEEREVLNGKVLNYFGETVGNENKNYKVMQT